MEEDSPKADFRHAPDTPIPPDHGRQRSFITRAWLKLKNIAPAMLQPLVSKPDKQ